MSRQLNNLPTENDNTNGTKKDNKLMISINGDLSIVKGIKKDKESEETEMVLISYNISQNIDLFLNSLTEQKSASISARNINITKED